MLHITSIAVFCGSSPGFEPIFQKAAYDAGRAISGKGCRLVYGGARVGLMGAVADGALSAGCEVIGVIPSFLQTKEIAHTGLTELITVDTMHERKVRMHALSDAIIALPGGWGTMEELTEMLTWAQLGLHQKPIGLLNTAGFYDGLVQLITTMQSAGFLKAEHAAMLLVDDEIESLIAALAAYEAPVAPKWITEATT